ncbi:hypothetical protein BASA61_010021 [Batrachochytrium salamandrivorans]|nr:hypothetical protein BASA61_010021 [Batrachochytrium salamandrivorans]
MVWNSKTSLHWLVLALACLMVFGNYYCYDLPSALNTPLYQYLGTDYSTYQYQLNLLYSVYSLPNVILPLVAGVLVDRFPSSYMMVAFSLLVCIGQGIFAAGVSTKSFPAMIFGRLLFGMGGESLEVASASIITEWFEGRQTGLAFALGMHLASARLATAANDNLSPWIAHRAANGVPTAVWVGLGVASCSLLCALGLGQICGGIFFGNFNRDSEEELAIEAPTMTTELESDDSTLQAQPPQTSIPALPTSASQSNAVVSHSVDEPSAAISKPTGQPSPQRSLPPALIITTPNTSVKLDALAPDDASHSSDADATSISALTDPQLDAGYESEEYDEEDEQVHVDQIWSFGGSFWLLLLTTIFIYGSILPFFPLFQEKWYPGDPQTAGSVMSVPDIISAVGSPLAGIVIDRVGHRSTLLPIASLIIFTAHAVLNYSNVTPLIAMVLLGVAYSLFASALWPCVPFLVGRHQIATAYGLLTSALNVSLLVFPIVVAYVRTQGHAKDFSGMQIFFMGMCVTAFVSCTALLAWDIRFGGGSLLKPSATATDVHSDSGTASTSTLVCSSEEPSSVVAQTDAVVVSPSHGSTPMVTVLGTTIHPLRDSVRVRRRSRPNVHITTHDYGGTEHSTRSAVYFVDGEASPITPVYKAHVVGNGMIVASPATVVHHHHHVPYARSVRARSPTRHPDSSTAIAGVASGRSHDGGSRTDQHSGILEILGLSHGEATTHHNSHAWGFGASHSSHSSSSGHSNCKCHGYNGTHIQEDMDPFDITHGLIDTAILEVDETGQVSPARNNVYGNRAYSRSASPVRSGWVSSARTNTPGGGIYSHADARRISRSTSPVRRLHPASSSLSSSLPPLPPPLPPPPPPPSS